MMKRLKRLQRKARMRRFSRRGAPKEIRQRPKVTGYESRRAVLRALGFRSYASYLASDLWRAIRQRVMERDGFACRTCGRAADLVHHRDYGYATMSGRTIDELLALCDPCHRKIEMAGARKRSFAKARALTRRLVEAFEFEPA